MIDDDEEMQDPRTPGHATDPYLPAMPASQPPREKPTVNTLMLDRMDDLRVELINQDNSIQAQVEQFNDLRMELTHILTGFNDTIKVMLGLAIAALAIGVVILCAVFFLFGAMR